MPRFSVLALSLVLASSARATTYVVDANGSGDFTSIGTAIAASQPGDVLLVLPGDYSSFVLNKGLRIVGYGNVAVLGEATITGIPADEFAAMVRVKAMNLTVSNCSGPVIVQEISNTSFPLLRSLDVSHSADVRLLALQSLRREPSSALRPRSPCRVARSAGRTPSR